MRGFLVIDQHFGASLFNGGFIGRSFLEGSAAWNMLGHIVGGAAFGGGIFFLDNHIRA